MGTSASIVLSDYHNNYYLWLRTNQDGYPSALLPLLTKFITEIKTEFIRDNIEQCSPRLVELGIEELRAEERQSKVEFPSWKRSIFEIVPHNQKYRDWMTDDYLYVIDLNTPQIRVYDKGVKLIYTIK